MEKEFVNYNQALKLKTLGFDEPCFGIYLMKEFRYSSPPMTLENTTKGIELLAPTFSQSFRWFREKYELHSYIYSDYSWNISGGIWDLNGYKDLRYDWDSEPYTTFEEAESACIEKLIEIVEQKNKK